jgi:hypothetical protein
MRIKLITCLLLLSAYFNVYSQKFEVGDIITLKASVPTTDKEVTLEGLNESNKMNILEYLDPNVKFYIIVLDKDKVKLRAVNFQPISTKKRNKLTEAHITIKSDYYNSKIYVVSRENFNAFAIKYEPADRITVGILTLPFKARPQEEFAFDTEFNLSSTLNIRLGKVTGTSLHYQLGAGVGSVGLNTSNANGIKDSEAQDLAILTFFNGLMLEYKKIQIGIYAGVDQINNQKNYDWVSNGNLWLGFGIGYNLFELASSNPKNNQD